MVFYQVYSSSLTTFLFIFLLFVIIVSSLEFLAESWLGLLAFHCGLMIDHWRSLVRRINWWEGFQNKERWEEYNGINSQNIKTNWYLVLHSNVLRLLNVVNPGTHNIPQMLGLLAAWDWGVLFYTGQQRNLSLLAAKLNLWISLGDVLDFDRRWLRPRVINGYKLIVARRGHASSWLLLHGGKLSA